jgi:RsiW-degrading membrane proteinase PrsW (M82 family)
MLSQLLRYALAPGGGPVHVGRHLRMLALATMALALVAMLCAAVYVLRRDTQAAFGVGAALAVLPVPVYLSVLIWADRFEPEPPVLLLAVFLWGAGAAVFLAYTLNTAGGRLVAERLGDDAAAIYVGSVSAPVVEETLKAVPLFCIAFFVGSQVDDLVDGVVYAGMVGLGFAMSENVLYYGRAAWYGDVSDAFGLFVVRGVWSPFVHPLFTAATGLAIAAATGRRAHIRLGLPPAGLGLAMALHSVWNTAVRAPWFDLVYIGLFVPLLAGLAVLVLRVRRAELDAVRTYLPRGLGPRLARSAAWSAAMATAERRRALRATGQARAGHVGAHAVNAYEHAATKLSLLERRIERAGVEVGPADAAARDQLRRRVVRSVETLEALGIAPEPSAARPGLLHHKAAGTGTDSLSQELLR